MRPKAVFFDVGETLVDETRMLRGWASWLEVPHATFEAALAQVIARDEHHRRVFEMLRPGFDVAKAVAERRARGLDFVVAAADFYPDALSVMTRLRTLGVLVGIAGNQPPKSEAALKAMGLPADIVAGSSTWGVEKPRPEFFARLIEAAGMEAGEIAYVGDRLDNDVLPARAAGLRTVLVRRGPWGRDHAARPEASLADLVVDDLAGLLRVMQAERMAE